MKLHNLRIGFATNSSSVHTIIIMAPGEKLEEEAEQYPGYYGWDQFQCTTPESKTRYLAALLNTPGSQGYLTDTIIRLLIEWLGPDANRILTGNETQNDISADRGLLVNSQSHFDMPLDRWQEKYDVEFIRDFREFLLSDRVAIIGGNDSCDEPFEKLPVRYEVWDNPLEHYPSGPFAARKDPLSNYWTLFNRRSGEKIRFSFEIDSPTPFKSFAPELVDLKITDFCERGCPYCYQGSSPQGSHASLATIQHVLEVLAEVGVMEVAIGGGEPLANPDLPAILDFARDHGIAPGLSTRSLQLLEQGILNTTSAARHPEMRYMGAVGYSVQTVAEVEAFAKIFGPRQHGDSQMVWKDRLDAPWKEQFWVAIHYTLGTGEGVKNIMRAAFLRHFPLILLGYKATGRGAGWTPQPEEDWFHALTDLDREGIRGDLGIDTVTAGEWKVALEQNRCHRILYEINEGKFSMYIDAVSGRVGPSSFCPEDQMVPVDLENLTAENLLNIFARF